MNTEELHERSKQRLIANLAKKEEEIVALSNTCETCKFWLTINCKREAQNQKSNFSNLICDDYRQEEWAIEPALDGVKLPEHLNVATEMANAIIGGFNPEQQNEMVRHIRGMVLNYRQNLIDETEKELSYLKNTFDNL